MYTIDDKVLNKILKRKFSSLVGNSCEIIEKILNENIEKSVSERLIKDSIKKFSYNAMRDIETQIALFSEGVTINVKFNRPVSE